MGNFDLVDKSKPDDEDHPRDFPNKYPWVYLVALENMPRIFAKAGTYCVEDPKQGKSQVFNIERAPKEEHLANSRSFVLEWVNRSRPPAEHVIVQ